MPLLDRARLAGEVRIQDARAEQAVLAFERSVQRAFSEADQALAGLAGERRRVEALAKGETRGRASYEATLIRYRRGLVDLQALLDAEASWRTARSQAASARVDELSRSVQLFKALGGGWASKDLEPGGRTAR